MDRPRTALVVGSTGSIGRLVVEEAAAAGYQVRALVRRPDRARGLPAACVQAVVGEVTRPETLTDAVQDVDAVVFTHGSNGTKAEMGAVDYGAVRNVLAALSERPVRIALMTSIGVTNRSSSYNRSTEGPDWKRRSERLVRASGRSYTIVRPGWFDYNAPDEQVSVFLFKETCDALAAPATGRSPDAKSPGFSSPASPVMPRTARPSSWWPNKRRGPAILSPFSLRSIPTSPVARRRPRRGQHASLW
jgi:uncharacterized protein YbjT (DUF2867 family)